MEEQGGGRVLPKSQELLNPVQLRVRNFGPFLSFSSLGNASLWLVSDCRIQNCICLPDFTPGFRCSAQVDIDRTGQVVTCQYDRPTQLPGVPARCSLSRLRSWYTSSVIKSEALWKRPFNCSRQIDRSQASLIQSISYSLCVSFLSLLTEQNLSPEIIPVSWHSTTNKLLIRGEQRVFPGTVTDTR